MDETVTLYNSSQTVLASVDVPLTATLDDGYFMQSITPIVLTPGSYVVAAFTGNNPWEFFTSTVTGTGVTFNSENYLYSSSPGFPSGGVSQAAGVYYGPTFDVSTTQTSAPEPGAWILVAAGLALARLHSSNPSFRSSAMNRASWRIDSNTRSYRSISSLGSRSSADCSRYGITVSAPPPIAMAPAIE